MVKESVAAYRKRLGLRIQKSKKDYKAYTQSIEDSRINSPKIPINIGDKIGSLIILSTATDKNKHKRYHVRCDCGKELIKTRCGILRYRIANNWCPDCARKNYRGKSNFDRLIQKQELIEEFEERHETK